MNANDNILDIIPKHVTIRKKPVHILDHVPQHVTVRKSHKAKKNEKSKKNENKHVQ